uniref:Uncharacterized protein n=1 Tax=viral metagenome TaxID=1070528 RepID=A0A6M3LRC9_9ZZZZ
MPLKNKIGYDVIETYREDELAQMYIKEGLPTKEAKIKARQLALSINKMASSERRFWKRVRENEMCVGTDPKFIEE